MNNESTRLYALNSLVICLSFTNLESILKIILLCISIVYTGMKIYDWVITKKDKNGNHSKETLQD